MPEWQAFPEPLEGTVKCVKYSYVNGGRFRIDNNLVENAIRPLTLGRKNVLFCGNHDAAIRAAIIYSLIGSCKAVGIDPRQWVEDVFVRITECEKNQDALTELLPSRWAKVNPVQA